jgi:hypothetical protein
MGIDACSRADFDADIIYLPRIYGSWASEKLTVEALPVLGRNKQRTSTPEYSKVDKLSSNSI